MKKIYKINLSASNFYGSDLIKINKAVKFVEEYFNSDEFKNFVLKFNFTDYYGSNLAKFHYNELTNQQVYDKIMSGSETLTPENDGEFDISIELDTKWTKSVIGYTYPNTAWQWIYAKFFNWWSPEEIAGNVAHEYMHKLGFDHEYQWTFNREYSVPYAVGYACENYSVRTKNMSYFKRFVAYFK